MSPAVMSFPPTIVAMSCSMFTRCSPNAGAFIAQHRKTPRMWFVTNSCSSSPSTSSAMMSNERCCWFTTSSNGMTSAADENLRLLISISGSSSSQTILSASLTKYVEKYPLSNLAPSTISRFVWRPFASSTVMTPSRPTSRIACARSSPISRSPFADIAPTFTTISSSSTGMAILFSSSITAATAMSMPFFISTAAWPDASSFIPPANNEYANVVAVVVPSPATSFVLCAASRIS